MKEKKGLFSWIQKGREIKKKTILDASGRLKNLYHGVLGFFSFKAFKQHERTKVSWTKGKLMNNPLGVRALLGFTFISRS